MSQQEANYSIGPQRPNEAHSEESGPLSHSAGVVFEPLPGAAEVRG